MGTLEPLSSRIRIGVSVAIGDFATSYCNGTDLLPIKYNRSTYVHQHFFFILQLKLHFYSSPFSFILTLRQTVTIYILFSIICRMIMPTNSAFCTTDSTRASISYRGNKTGSKTYVRCLLEFILDRLISYV